MEVGGWCDAQKSLLSWRYRDQQLHQGPQNKQSAEEEPASVILLSISPFIFIQCGSGVHFNGRRFHTGKAHRGSAVRPFRSI